MKLSYLLSFLFTNIIIVIFMINSALANVFAIDLSISVKPIYAFQCLRRLGYERVIIRGWSESQGGILDRSFLQNYKNAKAAGYTYIDVYMFPCAGRSNCKTPREQVYKLAQTIKDNRLIVRTIWLDIELSESNNWSLGPARNRQVIQEFYAAWKSTGQKFG